jgi:hypothetical protein
LLVDAGQPAAHSVAFAWLPPRPNPVVGWLRALPLVGSLIPPAPALQVDRPQTYRIRIERVVRGSDLPSAFAARLLDLGE